MNPMTQGYQYHAMWWRLCGDIAETNLRVMQFMVETGVQQARQAAVPMVAYSIYAANSVKPEEKAPDVVSALVSALAQARENTSKTDVSAQRISARRNLAARDHAKKTDPKPAPSKELHASAV